MITDELHALWSDPAHWSGIGDEYSCSADPRLVVPKRATGTGWTINMGHPRAQLVARSFMAGVIGLVVGIILLLARHR